MKPSKRKMRTPNVFFCAVELFQDVQLDLFLVKTWTDEIR